MAERRPNRVTGSAHDEFWAWCNVDELRIQRCDACGHLSWPPTLTCERCDDTSLTWQPISGTGTVASWCTFERRYYGELGVPWDTILVELDEGLLFLSNPWGFTNEASPSGLSVRVVFIACEDDRGPFRLPVFERE